MCVVYPIRVHKVIHCRVISNQILNPKLGSREVVVVMGRSGAASVGEAEGEAEEEGDAGVVGDSG